MDRWRGVIVSSVLCVAVIVFFWSRQKDPHRVLQEFFQTDAGEFKKFFGFEPNQPTSELHAIVQERVSKKTTMLWCAYTYAQEHGWKELAHDQLHIADRAMRLAEQFGYEPTTPSSRSFLSDLEGCPVPYNQERHLQD